MAPNIPARVKGIVEQVVPPRTLGSWEVIMVRCEKTRRLTRVYLDQFEDIFVKPGDQVWAKLCQCPYDNAELGNGRTGLYYYVTQVRPGQGGKLQRTSFREGLKGVA